MQLWHGAPRRRGRWAARVAQPASRRPSSAARASSVWSRSSSTPRADERRSAHSSRSIGVAGIGKSRLAWEFEKYIDGLVDVVWWHRGRCLAYGEGVAYWALAEMVRLEGGHPRGGARRVGAREAARMRRAARPRRRRARVDRAAARPPSRARGAARRRPGGSLLRRGAGSSSCSRDRRPRRAGLRGPPLGRCRHCSTSSNTSSSGPGTTRSSSSRWPGPELIERRPTWGAGRRSFHSVVLEPLAGEARGGARGRTRSGAP